MRFTKKTPIVTTGCRELLLPVTAPSSLVSGDNGFLDNGRFRPRYAGRTQGTRPVPFNVYSVREAPLIHNPVRQRGPVRFPLKLLLRPRSGSTADNFFRSQALRRIP